ncbi:glycosyltransferase [Scleromatobacter humisilvae]|uniref:Glycosyltransferase n=1 Tax=Scleromatobacter humisilvae TaxID=2897159 RepID=A0A9X2BY21_9BURK|nr:glycosyltransferase [Scleromatobacter humisilvae]MCK9684962.1 glycosyltransferase [Scleromatobacter humisilvae]
MTAAPLTIVHAVFSSRLAGGERHCVDLAQAQAAMGHRVHIVGPARSAVRHAVGPNVQYHGIALPLARGMRFRRIVEKLGAAICHGHLGPACKAVAQVMSATRIGTLHVGYKAHHHATMDGLICVNSAQRARLGDYGGEAKVIFNWAPQRDESDAGDLRAELGLRHDQMLVGSLGRLNQAKGMDFLIAAFRAKAPADAVLAILGEGEEMGALQRLADGDPRVRLLGFRSDVNAALGAMDLFVSASREEAFPLAILEAMRAGVPVISSATQGPLEMLAGQPAQIVPIGDVPALGEAIAATLERIGALPRAQRRPVAYDVSAYDRTTAVARTIAFYRQVTAQRRTHAVPEPRRAASGIGHA